MNREIKFRAWHIDLNDMTYSEGCEKHFYNKAFVNYPYLYKVMQFIGLTDKNGKEIYEGDILQYLGAPCNDLMYIIFDDGAFKAYNNKLGYYDIMHGTKEVIGNIYENLELLK